jgi:hypothetical protein
LADVIRRLPLLRAFPSCSQLLLLVYQSGIIQMSLMSIIMAGQREKQQKQK